MQAALAEIFFFRLGGAPIRMISRGRLGDETSRVPPDLWVPGFLIQRVFSPSATNPQTCQTPGELLIELKWLQQTRYGEPLPASVAADPSRPE